MYCEQGLWHIAGLIHSFNADRKKVAKKMLQQCHAAIQPNKPAQAQMLADSQELFTTLINLASFQCKVLIYFQSQKRLYVCMYSIYMCVYMYMDMYSKYLSLPH